MMDGRTSYFVEMMCWAIKEWFATHCVENDVYTGQKKALLLIVWKARIYP